MLNFKHDALKKRFLFSIVEGRARWQGKLQRQASVARRHVPINLKAELHLFMPKLACNGVHIKMLKTTPSFLRSLGWPGVDLEVPGFGSKSFVQVTTIVKEGCSLLSFSAKAAIPEDSGKH